MARYVQDSDTPLPVCQAKSDDPPQAVTQGLAVRIAGPDEREPVSSVVAPWRDLIGLRHAGTFRWVLLTAALLLVAPGAGFAQERIFSDELISPVPQQTVPIGPPTPEEAHQRLNWETRAGRSYVIPAGELIGYLLLLNQFDRHFVEPNEIYRTGTKSFRTNLTDSKWVVDNDPFATNQFLHPYGGSIYYGLARSTGLNFWESLGYATAGSFLWELGGETGPPSINDQITTPIAGTFLGEPLFRMASLLLRATVAGRSSGRNWRRRCSHRPPASTASSSATGSTPCFRATLRPSPRGFSLARV